MKKICLSIFLAVLLVQSTQATTLTLDVPPSFSKGQQIYFEYSITSDISQQIVFIPSIFCPKSTVKPLEQMKVNLISNVPYNNVYSDKIVDASFEPQTCTAQLLLLPPTQQVFSKNFSIITNPAFSFDLKTCLDVYCSVESKVFVQNEGIYLDYSSDIENPSIKATLTYPDGAKKQTELPTSIKAEQAGTYEIEVTASKEGYKTITKKQQFGVIENLVDFPLISGKPEITNIMETEIIPKGDLVLLSLIAFIVILIVIVVSIIYFLIRKNETYGIVVQQAD